MGTKGRRSGGRRRGSKGSDGSKLARSEMKRRTLRGAIEPDIELLHVVVHEVDFVVGHQPVCVCSRRAPPVSATVQSAELRERPRDRAPTYSFMTSVSIRRLPGVLYPSERACQSTVHSSPRTGTREGTLIMMPCRLCLVCSVNVRLTCPELGTMKEGCLGRCRWRSVVGGGVAENRGQEEAGGETEGGGRRATVKGAYA